MNYKFIFKTKIPMLLLASVLTACGGGGSNGSADTTSPVITLNGNASESVVINGTFTDAGVIVSDNVDTDIDAVISGSVNLLLAGEYELTYNATDSAGNQALPVKRIATVIDGVAFKIPSTFYSINAFLLNQPIYVDKFDITSNTSMSLGFEIYENGSLEVSPYSNSYQYYYSDNAWVEYNLANFPIKMTEADTKIESEIFNRSIIESVDISNTSINIFDQDYEYADIDNLPSFLMPPGSVRTEQRYQSAGTKYRLFRQFEPTILNLDTLLSSECGNQGGVGTYINLNFDFSGYRAFIPCDEILESSGMLKITGEIDFGGEFETITVGSWKRENIPGSNIEVLILEADPSLLIENDYRLTSHQLYAVVENKVWSGAVRLSDYSNDSTIYNQIAFDAIISALNDNNAENYGD